MNILRLSTVSLTLAIAVFALGYANPSFAAPKNCVDDDPRPSCPKDDPEPDPPTPSVTYTAQLTGVFATDPVNVSPNGKENTLFPDFAGDLKFVRSLVDASPAQIAWDLVFNDCAILGPTGFVFPSFTVSADNLSYQKPGGVGVALGGIEARDKDGNLVNLHLWLIGDEFDFGAGKQFVPAVGETSTFDLKRFWLTGHTEKGVKPRGHCNKDGGTPDLGAPPNTLVITAT